MQRLFIDREDNGDNFELPFEDVKKYLKESTEKEKNKEVFFIVETISGHIIRKGKVKELEGMCYD